MKKENAVKHVKKIRDSSKINKDTKKLTTINNWIENVEDLNGDALINTDEQIAMAAASRKDDIEERKKINIKLKK